MDASRPECGTKTLAVLLASFLFTPQSLVTVPGWIRHHGGCAAIIPYSVCVLTVGIPLVFLELSLGQFMQRSGTRLWAVVPLFKGLAISSMLTSLVRSAVNCVMASWAGFYIYLTLTNQIPSCNTTRPMSPTSMPNERVDWSSDVQDSTLTTRPSNTSLDVLDNIVATNKTVDDFSKSDHIALLLMTPLAMSNHSQSHSTPIGRMAFNHTLCRSAFVDLWRKEILEVTTSITSPGQSVLHLLIGNGVVVIVTIFIVGFGVGVLRKVLTLMVPLWMTISVALLAQVCVRDLQTVLNNMGAAWSPDWHLLTQPQLWASCIQVVLTTHGTSVGVLSSMGSFLRWNNTTLRDTIMTCVLTMFINILASLLVFAISDSAATLESPDPFITIPMALSLHPHSSIWIALFFLLVILVIVSTNALYWEAVVLTVTDASKQLSRWRLMIAIGTASIVFLLTVPMSLQGGIYSFRLLDYVTFGPFLVGIVACLQSVVIAFLYGGHKLYDNLETMTGYRPHWWMRCCWAWLCPPIVAASLCFHGYQLYHNPLSLGVVEPYHHLSNIMVLIMTCTILLPIPLAAVWVLCSGPAGCSKKMAWSVQPRLHPFQIPIKWRLDRKWHKFSPLG